MTTSVIPAVGAGVPLRVLDCSLGAMAHALPRRWLTSDSCQSVARFALDIITGGIIMAGATETLVPLSLVDALHNTYDDNTPGEGPQNEMWGSMEKYRQFIIFAAPRDVPKLIRRFPQYKKVCLCAPSGPLASRMLFGKYFEEFYAEELNPALYTLADAGDYKCTVWLRSSLTCRYEGLYVPPIRVAETAARLLSCEVPGASGSCSCERVVLEEGVCGLTPRWLETAIKTASSCGIPINSIMLALCRGSVGSQSENYLLSKVIRMGMVSVAASSVPAPVFPETDELLGIDDIHTFSLGWNDAYGGRVSAEELESTDDCVEYCAAVRERWLRWPLLTRSEEIS
ncbi:unnamed protein product [Trypanosoma congolense IL3000]|uniref:WGS project CAEQ00000000 data, annotated contig 1938 n=1 Tax=Trypanosoma congolense (strain IL3000) TaxID=1068625 RepID=F9WA54_TRYCI|nr:unnamed protein product [Trypanosoma congolense IL3000]